MDFSVQRPSVLKVTRNHRQPLSRFPSCFPPLIIFPWPGPRRSPATSKKRRARRSFQRSWISVCRRSRFCDRCSTTTSWRFPWSSRLLSTISRSILCCRVSPRLPDRKKKLLNRYRNQSGAEPVPDQKTKVMTAEASKFLLNSGSVHIRMDDGQKEAFLKAMLRIIRTSKKPKDVSTEGAP